MVTQNIDGIDFVALHYPFNRFDAIKITTETRDINKHLQYIHKKNIEKAYIVLPNLNFLYDCTNLKFLRIAPSHDVDKVFDFSPLYQMPEVRYLNCVNTFGFNNNSIAEIDYAKITGLQTLAVDANKGSLNFDLIPTLKTLIVGNYKSKTGDISNLFSSAELDTLRLVGCKNNSLNGIEKSTKIQCVYLSHNRVLQDISALKKVNKTLKALRIENCSQIKDFSVLKELHSLELLELSGSNTLKNLDFIKELPNLKTFVFNMDVVNGDLTPCLNLSYVFSEKNRKHYNLKDTDLPKKQYIRGNENIEEWRKLE